MTIKNDMSYYLPKMQNCNLNIPYTAIFKLTDRWYKWVQSDHYEEADIKKFDKYLKNLIKKAGLENEEKLFIKTGVYSGKFNFNERCLYKKGDNLGEHVLNLFYDQMLYDIEPSRDVVIRKFIETEYDRPTIYNGMKLNTEFRIFFDFANRRFLGCFNYWDTKVMLNNLRNKDKDDFFSAYKSIENDFGKLESKLIKHLQDAELNKADLKETWSIDFLWDGKKFWMIDMALAKNSYYYDKVVNIDLNRNKDDNGIILTRKEKQEQERMQKEMHEHMMDLNNKFAERLKNKNS